MRDRVHLVPGGRHVLHRDLFTHVDAVDEQTVATTVVRLHEDADGPRAPPLCTRREPVPVPPLKSWQIIPVPPPTFPSGTAPFEAPSIAEAGAPVARGTR